jgi:transcriptional regulator with AAA-type ATPase domain/tetratricopeptide (TPR) repeat protein
MDEPAELLGDSPIMEAVRDTLRRLLDRQEAGRRFPPVLLQGETGTGKGLIAHLLHRRGARGQAPFIDVNCAAIPEPLLEAELFGFERGAFTDARHPKPGLFHAAHGGVLFLDEVALLPDSAQAKLLSALEERAVRRLGSTRSEPFDVWLISATNADLKAAVGARRFREDLYHRLAVVTVDLPPLRDRGRDILLLAERFLARACADYGLPPQRLDTAARTRLLAYAWPGNIRELANVLERAALLADGPAVTADDVGPLETVGAGVAAPGFSAATAATRDEATRGQLLAALERTGWNISLTAAQLGIARNTVYARLERYGLRADAPRKAAAGPLRPVALAGARRSGDRLEWERRSLTLLRADLRSPDAVDAVSQGSRALDAIIAKVHNFGGRVEELTPMGVAAVFGLVPTEDAARRAAHAAMAIHKELQRLPAEGPRITIGLHVAPLLIGCAGGRMEIDAGTKRAEWPVLEHLVHAGAAGDTIASAAAAPFLERRFEMASMEVVDGQEPVYRLTGQERRGLALWGAMTPFVGRAEELEILRSRLTLAQGGRGQLVAVVGEAGVGKSRLIHELARAQRLPGWRVLEATALSYGQAMSYLPVIALLKGYFALQDRDDVREMREKVTGKLLTLDRTLEPTLTALLDLLDVPVHDGAWRTLDPGQRRQRTLDGLKRLLLREAREQPLLLIVEDLHWIDNETKALLDGVADSLGSGRLLLLVTYRPEYSHAWSGKTYYSEVGLNALSADRAGELLEALLGEDPGLASLKQMLVKRGNPFFLEETVRTLVETKALTGERGRYRLTQPIQTIQVPPTVHAMLAARIDRLAPEDKRLLQVAAVVGKDVPFALLQAIADLPDEPLRGGLDRLRAAEFIYETGLFPDIEHSFKHALTHEVTYGGLLQERRRNLHARIVDAIETLHRDRLGGEIERLAHHALRGELREKAVHYLRQAGLKAAARSAPQDARGWFEQALAALAELPESPSMLKQGFDVRLELRPMLIMLGEVRRALERLREAEALAERLNDDRRRGQVCAVLTNAYSHLGELDEAVVTGTRALEIAGRLGDLRLRLLTTTYLEQAHHRRGEYERVVELATDNLAALPADSDYESFGASLPLSIYDRSWLIQSLAELGRFAEAAPYEAEAFRLAEATQHAYTVGMVHDDAGRLHLLKGDWVKARALIEHGIAAYGKGNTVMGFSRLVANSAWILAHVGEASEALTRLRESEQLLERDAARGYFNFHRTACGSLGHAALLLGRLDEARSLGERALEYSPSHPGNAAHSLHLLGEVATHPDRFDAASGEGHYRKALALAEPRGMRPLAAHCHLGLGKLYRRTDNREQAREHLATATTMYREMGMTYWLERAEAEMG